MAVAITASTSASSLTNSCAATSTPIQMPFLIALPRSVTSRSTRSMISGGRIAITSE